MSDFLQSLLKSIDFVGLIDFFLHNLVWICVGGALLLALLLGIGLFKGKKRWLWRSILMGAAVLAVLIGVKTTNFYSAYTEYDVDATTNEVITETGDASRYAVGHDHPQFAKDIEFLIIGVEDVDKWEAGPRLLSWQKVYSNDSGTATMTRYMFVTEIKVETKDGTWEASELFGNTNAQVEYND